jgi:hypothetical protein
MMMRVVWSGCSEVPTVPTCLIRILHLIMYGILAPALLPALKITER